MMNHKRIDRVIATTMVWMMITGASLAVAAPPDEKAESSAAEGVVNINTASPEELERLPGIGPSKSQAIVEFRAKKKFRSTQEFVQVKGIGQKTFRRLKPYLTVDGPTTLKEKPSVKKASR